MRGLQHHLRQRAERHRGRREARQFQFRLRVHAEADKVLAQQILDLVARQWGITILEDTHRLNGLLLVHDPAAVSTDASDFVVAGHVHPAINLPAGCGPRRAPVFALAESMLLLPAFTTFAAGAPIRASDFVRLVAIADNELVPMTGPARRPPRDITP